MWPSPAGVVNNTLLPIRRKSATGAHKMWRSPRYPSCDPNPGLHQNRQSGAPTRLAPFEGDAGGFAVPGRRRHTVIAQLVLEDAADRIAREVVAELDVARNGEVRDALDAPLAELGLGERDVGL